MRNLLNPIIGAALGSVAVWLTSSPFESFLASRWLEVRSVLVTVERGSNVPLVTVDRTVHKPFTALWTTTIWQQNGRGFVRFCTHDGQHEYLPEAVLPARTDLNYWLSVPPKEPCPPMGPGRYKVSFVWIISSDGHPVHSVEAESNLFDVPR